jgi:hypothetical protein
MLNSRTPTPPTAASSRRPCGQASPRRLAISASTMPPMANRHRLAASGSMTDAVSDPPMYPLLHTATKTVPGMSIRMLSVCNVFIRYTLNVARNVSSRYSVGRG